MFKGKKVLVTGGTGMIGIPLVRMLIEQGARVRSVSLDDASRSHPDAEFLRLNLMQMDNCLKACEGMDFVFHLAGIKGSPAMTAAKPASFFVPTLTFSLNMMEAARQQRAGGYLFTSSIGVYAPAERFREDDVWSSFPSKNDWFAGWAKRMGELQAQAYAIEYGWKNIVIVRPANVYGPYDNFDAANAMVIPSLIRRALDGEDPLVIWGDGSPLRDFIHARDVARGMLIAAERGTGQTLNLGSGKGTSIKQVSEAITVNLERKPKIVWDKSKPMGDQIRLMDVTRAQNLGFCASITLQEGIRETMDWYRSNKDRLHDRYNVFTDGVVT
ncbi:MAG: NAD-dependent epimerase/dehydratase family protein [Elusimicrobiota bacterium]